MEPTSREVLGGALLALVLAVLIVVIVLGALPA
jgi:hypothetical protein